MRKVPIDQLHSNMVLGIPVYSDSHILINAGVTGLDQYALRLQKMGVFSLFIEDDAGEGIEIEELITTETRMKCKQTLSQSFQKLDARLSVNMREITSVTEQMLGEILSNKNILYNLNEIGNIGDNTLDHSVNTSIYAICLANQLHYSDSKLLDLATGTLLHDIGKTVLDHDILFKPGKLTKDEFDHVKEHVKLGYDILSKDLQIPEPIKQICLCHHERIDGSGYLRGMLGEQLHEYIKITSIVDVYEALTVNRCYHNAVTPSHAVEILAGEASSKLDFSLVSTFIQNIAIYPSGSTVLLSTGSYAIVKEQNSSFPLRPVVRLIEIEDGVCVPKEEIDLMVTLNITIIDSDVTIPTS